jgi:hypothetical protein
MKIIKAFLISVVFALIVGTYLNGVIDKHLLKTFALGAGIAFLCIIPEFFVKKSCDCEKGASCETCNK